MKWLTEMAYVPVARSAAQAEAAGLQSTNQGLLKRRRWTLVGVLLVVTVFVAASWQQNPTSNVRNSTGDGSKDPVWEQPEDGADMPRTKTKEQPETETEGTKDDPDDESDGFWVDSSSPSEPEEKDEDLEKEEKEGQDVDGDKEPRKEDPKAPAENGETEQKSDEGNPPPERPDIDFDSIAANADDSPIPEEAEEGDEKWPPTKKNPGERTIKNWFLFKKSGMDPLGPGRPKLWNYEISRDAFTARGQAEKRHPEFAFIKGLKVGGAFMLKDIST
jgi:hypothetical protein